LPIQLAKLIQESKIEYKITSRNKAEMSVWVSIEWKEMKVLWKLYSETYFSRLFSVMWFHNTSYNATWLYIWSYMHMSGHIISMSYERHVNIIDSDYHSLTFSQSEKHPNFFKTHLCGQFQICLYHVYLRWKKWTSHDADLPYMLTWP
jgi:hypothetical protein